MQALEAAAGMSRMIMWFLVFGPRRSGRSGISQSEEKTMKVCLAGQGAFGMFMRGLAERGLEAPLRESIARGVATEPGELPAGDELGAVLDAAAGLARAEAEGAFALSLVRHGRLLPANTRATSIS